MSLLLAYLVGLWFLLSLATLFLWIGGLWIYPRVTAWCSSGRPQPGAPAVPTPARAAHHPCHLRLLGPDAAGPRPRAGAARWGARHHATGAPA